jgi:hypothetical protein
MSPPTPEKKSMAERSTFLRFARWLMSPRVLRRMLLILIWVVSLVVLFYAFENWRGSRAWNNYRRAAETRGDKLKISEMAPPAVPESLNFASTPLVQSWFIKDSDYGKTSWDETYSKASSLVETKRHEQIAERQLIDLVAWAEAFAAVNSGSNINALEVPRGKTDPGSRASAATSVLKAMQPRQAALDQLREASRRPYCVYPIQYATEPSAAILLPHLARIKGVCQHLHLKVSAELEAGNSDEALSDIELMIYMGNSLEREPILISQLVHAACRNLALYAVWEGLVQHRWTTDAQLIRLQSLLSPSDFVHQARFAFEGERAFGVSIVDWLRRTRDWKGFGGGDNPGESIAPIVVWAMPSGWFRFEQRNLASYLDDFIKEGIGEGGNSIRPRQVDAAWRTVLKRFEPQAVCQRIWNHTLASGLLMPALGKALTRFAATQVGTEEAVIACGLERYWVQNNSYPEKLEQIVPRFLERLPADALSDEPYHYARENGGYKLWSVGWNAKDDGGMPGKNLFDIEGGDWVWRGSTTKLLSAKAP